MAGSVQSMVSFCNSSGIGDFGDGSGGSGLSLRSGSMIGIGGFG